jgi:enoyl-CoA hydratase/carnithine racemase
MDLKYVIYEKTPPIAKVTLNRPEIGNALELNLARDLLAAVEDIRSDNSIMVVVITGAGKTFCAGGDVKYLLSVVSEGTNMDCREFLKELAMPIFMLRELRQPVVAAINGAAVGGGFDFLLHCDIRVASENAVMGPIWVHNAVIPVMGAMYLLPKLIGHTRATEMILRGQTIRGREAEEIGLVNKAVPLEKLDEEVMSIAEDIARKPPLAIELAKRGLQRGMDLNLQHELEYALYLQSVLFKTEDFKEGLRAFLEKREPRFRGS